VPIVKINGHDMYYEVHGKGEPLICIGGWGTFCHGAEGNLARGLTDRYSVLLIDYRGIGESSDDLNVEPTTQLYAQDIIELFDHLGWKNVRFVGLVGMGACVAQEVAIHRPELVRCMVNTACWIKMDTYLQDQLELFLVIHKESGFLEFQRLCTVMSFLPDYYNENKDRLLGSEGVWSELNGRYQAHERLVRACITHDTADRLDQILAPTLVVHSGQDQMTGPRTTKPLEMGLPNAEGVMMENVAHIVAGKEQKIQFAQILLGFLEQQ
jgi:3-oxoadipate enol-lactonase